MILNLALSYGGRHEILRAAKRIAQEVQAGRIQPDDITQELFSNYLYTSGMPDPNLLIRTSGEMRISNFLLWQISYSEIWVTERCWPEFDEAQLHLAIRSYAARDRRFGGLHQ